MPSTATVNYHVHASERQAYHIDAGGVVGKIISPEHDVTEVLITDVRIDGGVSFDQDSVGFLTAPSTVSAFEQDRAWQDAYDQELTDLLTREVGATEVIIFDHTVRIDDPNATRKPARNVHSDYSPEGAQQRLIDILGEAKAAEWSNGHYGFINVWRPVAHPINSAPLGFVRPSSVADKDWLLLDLIYPDRRGHIMGLVGNPNHEWVYQSRMTPDEVALFNIYDNRGKPSVAHSALDMAEDPTITSIRQSIESRTLVRYGD
ncbi:CmcJ/NvfI family oxidoreductase [Cognatiyoonia sp. IB215182]|uniref:CmcJ/NvfI family oxidoreductase n=1 Tax=Cognatiyoonia sp. IB215182 TaxID=3097353 RepID=UPI002A15B358|nr:CmcJ/NvfI family oxidoreductase [Cognatiyoonia sp. IB215182]MDX8354863.1 CmcJ/NvfI family oxidoreductase [Cognatiyoonia sp. IB215182]